MSVTHSTCLVADTVNIREASEKNVCYGFLLHLPFRLRLGETFYAKVKAEGTDFDFWFKNRISIPHEQLMIDTIQKHKTFSNLWTEVFALVKHPSVNEEDIKKLRASNLDENELKCPSGSNYIFGVMKALNHFIVAYATGANVLFGGAPLRLFRTNDFMEIIEWEITLLTEENKEIDEENLNYIFDLKPDKHIKSVAQFTGELDDLDSKTLSAITKSLDIQGEFLFYEHAMEAKSKMIAGDYVGALLMAVAALEGAHAVYVSDVLTTKMPHKKDNREFVDGYLKELGMTLCNRLTPYLLMQKEEQPDPDTLDMAGKGIKYRNEIMHALRNRRGQYRHRLRTNKELCDAYSAVLKVYECYRRGVENRSK